MENEAKVLEARILTDAPVIEVIAEMNLDEAGIARMANWVGETFPDCLPDEFDAMTDHQKAASLFPHVDPVSDNELLVELAGRKCYNSFGLKAGRKSNREYIENTQRGDVPHASIMYHAKMTFFFGGISRRVSHELIRHYVGADRTEEGSPSQESTRYVEHAGRYVAHPRVLDDAISTEQFTIAMVNNYVSYLSFIEGERSRYREVNGKLPTGMARKRIFEAASSFLSHACETSFLWTTNPIAVAKLIRERDHDAADLEIRRFAKKLKKTCVERWPNLFPQPWMTT